jgi:CheY-like chemotaxis protein
MTKILLVDDDRHSNDALAAALRLLGYAADVAGDGEEAVKRIEAVRPDIAIVDLMLPGISGIELVRSFSAPPWDLYCCLASGMMDFALLRRALANGAWTVLSKPFQLAHLSAMLHGGVTIINAQHAMSGVRSGPRQNSLTITRRGDTPVTSEDLAHAMQFARQCGADDVTALRWIPIVTYELLNNARTYGAQESSDGWYRLNLEHGDSDILLQVSDSGKGFGWTKELARVRTSWDKSNASGLQLISALCSHIHYGGEPFTATVSLSKTSSIEYVRAATSDVVG